MRAKTKTAREDANPLLLREQREGIAWLTLNRPAFRNALSLGLLQELLDALDSIGSDAAVKVVVIAGQGPAFCSGHDLRELRANPSRQNYQATFALCSKVMQKIVHLPKPVIAKVQGQAVAAGCQLVASCDLAVASRDAEFATPGVDIGLFCSTPMVALSRAVGRKAAMKMLLLGDRIDAETAQAWGLINQAVPNDKLDAETERLARTIAQKSPLILAIGKEAFYRQVELPLTEAYEYASEVMTRNMMAQDAAEGIDAFLEQRPPRWRNR
jgi:enoyl-CoA hydratase/carnithine racemase